jgi:hypothetical protein
LRGCCHGTVETYDVASNESARAQHVDPQSQEASQLLARHVVEGIVQHGLEAVKAREHGKEESVEIARHAVAILGSQQFGRGIVGLDQAFVRVFEEEQQSHGLVAIAG